MSAQREHLATTQRQHDANCAAPDLGQSFNPTPAKTEPARVRRTRTDTHDRRPRQRSRPSPPTLPTGDDPTPTRPPSPPTPTIEGRNAPPHPQGGPHAIYKLHAPVRLTKIFWGCDRLQHVLSGEFLLLRPDLLPKGVKMQ